MAFPVLYGCANLTSACVSASSFAPWYWTRDPRWSWSDLLLIVRSLPAQLENIKLEPVIVGGDDAARLTYLRNMGWERFEDAISHCTRLRMVNISAVFLYTNVTGYLASSLDAQTAILDQFSPKFRRLVCFLYE